MFFIHNSFVLEKVLEKEQKIKPYTTKWLYINGRGRRTWSRLPARSVLLHFVQRSPPETRTPQHAPRASESKSFYSMPKQKRSPFGNRFRFGRGRRTWTLGTRFWRPLLYQLSYTPMWWAFGDSNPGPTGYEPAALTNWAKGPSDCLSLIFEKERVPPPEWRHSWLPLLDSNQRHRG